MSVNYSAGLLIALSVTLLHPSRGDAGVIGHAGIPTTSGGIAMSCSNPFQTIAIVRAKNSTLVIQSTPMGAAWRVRLPAMRSDYDQYWMAPDGEGAVVAVSVSAGGQAFVVSSHHAPLEIAGVLSAVDFQSERVLVATEGDEPGMRVRVFDRKSGKVVGDSIVEDQFGDGFKRFFFRLSGDGRAYYYLAFNESGGEVPVVRDVVDGRIHQLGYNIPGQVDDMVLQSVDNGILAVSGKAYVINDNVLSPVYANKAVGWIDQIIDPNGSAIHAVKGQRGWGVVDRSTGDWLKSTSGFGHLYAGEAGLVVLDNSINSSSIKTYDFTGGKPKLVRRSSEVSKVGEEIVCVNVFGVMTYQEGKFTWNRSN